MIYQPKGRALEYSPLACNIAVGCEHRCAYCYGPGAFRRSVHDWSDVRWRKDAVKKFAESAKRYHGDQREILFCFATDPFQNEHAAGLMKELLPIAEAEKLRVQVLTKNPALALRSVGDQLRRNGWWLGSTIIFIDDKLRETWEPGAPPCGERVEAIKEAHENGIKTWVSVEPVVDEEEALRAIEAVLPHVDKIKLGKLNHHKHAQSVNWTSYLGRAKRLVGEKPCLIKDDLRVYDV